MIISVGGKPLPCGCVPHNLRVKRKIDLEIVEMVTDVDIATGVATVNVTNPNGSVKIDYSGKEPRIEQTTVEGCLVFCEHGQVL